MSDFGKLYLCFRLIIIILICNDFFLHHVILNYISLAVYIIFKVYNYIVIHYILLYGHSWLGYHIVVSLCSLFVFTVIHHPNFVSTNI